MDFALDCELALPRDDWKLVCASGETTEFGNLIPGLFGGQLQIGFLWRRHFEQHHDNNIIWS